MKMTSRHIPNVRKSRNSAAQNARAMKLARSSPGHTGFELNEVRNVSECDHVEQIAVPSDVQ